MTCAATIQGVCQDLTLAPGGGSRILLSLASLLDFEFLAGNERTLGGVAPPAIGASHFLSICLPLAEAMTEKNKSPLAFLHRCSPASFNVTAVFPISLLCSLQCMTKKSAKSVSLVWDRGLLGSPLSSLPHSNP